MKIVSADITDEAALAGLPDAKNVVFLVGSKFGSTGREADTWYTNAYLPGRVADRYKSSRIVALSTGNVYAFTPVGSGGPTEPDWYSPGMVAEMTGADSVSPYPHKIGRPRSAKKRSTSGGSEAPPL